MSTDIKALADNVLRRHREASTQSQPSETQETTLRVPETGSRYESGSKLKPPESYKTPEDIDLALKIAGYLEALPAHQSATATEIAEALHGRNHTLAQMTEIYAACEELREARILIRGRDGYGYCFRAFG